MPSHVQKTIDGTRCEPVSESVPELACDWSPHVHRPLSNHLVVTSVRIAMRLVASLRDLSQICRKICREEHTVILLSNPAHTGTSIHLPQVQPHL
jgi:hypothetical protein